MDLISLLKKDFAAKRQLYCYENTAKGSLKTFLTDGTSANILYRTMQYSNHLNIIPLAWLFQYINKIINGCIIGLKAEMGAGLVLVHPVGIIINSAVIAGENLIIQSGVVVGENKGQSPKLGNNIFIGSGAKIFGGITIHDNASIGANAVVVKSLEENQKAFGVPSHKS